MDFKCLNEMIVKKEDELVIDDIIAIYKNEYKNYEDYINYKIHIQEEVNNHNRTKEEAEGCQKFWLNPIVLSYELFSYIKSKFKGEQIK